MTGQSEDTSVHAGKGEAPPHRIDLDAGRRTFFKVSGLAAASASLFGLTALSGTAQAQSAPTDVQVLNFALNLEYLEAEFYLRAATGQGLASTDTDGQGTPGEVLGGAQVPFTDTLVADYANEIANDELTHVRFLRSALGASKVARPKLNIKGAFTKAAVAAGVLTPSQVSAGQTFDPYASDINFLLAAYIFEDVGVTAYHGAAQYITNKDYLTAAAGILAVEAYHAGLVRTVLFAKQMADPSLTLFRTTRQISALRTALAQPTNGQPDDQGISSNESQLDGGPRTLSNIVPTDVNGLAFARSPTQVLNIVYGSTTTQPGLFFPNGINAGNAS